MMIVLTCYYTGVYLFCGCVYKDPPGVADAFYAIERDNYSEDVALFPITGIERGLIKS